ncbi:TPR repeat protein [Minicystis rosea]|nr:TPR repeat protein [Minicystis rosea]
MGSGGALAVAVHHDRIAVFLRFAGRAPEAALGYARAEGIRRANGEPTPSTCFHNLAGLACADGDFDAAERHARAAVSLSSQALGDDGLSLGGDLCGLGDALSEQGRSAEAEACYRRALELHARSARPDHPEIAYALHNLGDAQCALGRTADAEASYRESIVRKTCLFGERHHEIAGTLANLGAMLFESGRRDEGRASVQQALSIAREVLPLEPPSAQPASRSHHPWVLQTSQRSAPHCGSKVLQPPFRRSALRRVIGDELAPALALTTERR